MSDTTTPMGSVSTPSEALTHNQGEDAISKLISGFEDELLNTGADEGDEIDTADDGSQDDASDEEQLNLEDEEVADEEASQDGPKEKTAKDGQFVPDGGKVTLDDGTVLTVAELKRNNLFQRDYTRKTTELAAERAEFAKQRDFVGQHAQAIVQQREVLAKYMEQYLPKAPDVELARTDPYKYQIERAKYEKDHAALTAIQEGIHAAQLRQQEAAEAELAEIKLAEAGKLFAKLPHLQDQAKMADWYAKASKVMIDVYGFTPEEVNEATDSRFYLLMNDALTLANARSKKPGVQKQMASKPRLVQGSGNRNQAPMDKVQRLRSVSSEALRKTGSMEAAVAKLSTFDL